jgi:hypothetical protein
MLLGGDRGLDDRVSGLMDTMQRLKMMVLNMHRDNNLIYTKWI